MYVGVGICVCVVLACADVLVGNMVTSYHRMMGKEETGAQVSLTPYFMYRR